MQGDRKMMVSRDEFNVQSNSHLDDRIPVTGRDPAQSTTSGHSRPSIDGYCQDCESFAGLHRHVHFIRPARLKSAGGISSREFLRELALCHAAARWRGRGRARAALAARA